MKNVLLACLLLVATGSMSYAQAPRPTASKSDFTTKVNDLNSLILAGNMTAAQAKWDDINKIAINEFGVLKFRIKDDEATGNTADKTHCQALNASQRTLFSDAVALKNNMATNRAALIAKLTSFAADMF